MSGQLWHDFLATDFSSQMGTTDTKATKRRQRIHSILTPPSSDPHVKPRSTAGEPFIWQNHSYIPSILPVENVVCQILWELYKLTFTQEFLSLDHRACGNLDLTDNEQILERQSLVLRCLKGFNSTPLPNSNCGMTADTIRDRLPYLQFMVQVMLAWKGTKPASFNLADHPPQSIADQQAKEFEDAATKYYCQQFFRYFGRAAQVPHRLFPTANN